jgi:signal transduction histidine kinase
LKLRRSRTCPCCGRRTRLRGAAPTIITVIAAIERVREVVRRHPTTADAVGAFVLFAFLLTVPHPDTESGQQVPTVATFVAASMALALPARRLCPRATVAVTASGAAVALQLAGGAEVYLLPLTFALYALAVRTDRRPAIIAFGLSALVLGVVAAGRHPDEGLGAVADLIAWTGVPTAWGIAVRNRRAYVGEIQDRALRAEQTQEEVAGRRVAEERLRIARELHDVVAHHVAVVSVQAGLAEHLIHKKPDAAQLALRNVQEASAAILNELGGILRVLRESGESLPATHSAPGLDQLDALVAFYLDAGLDVTWSTSGQPRAIGGTLDLVAYRVAQEALTNAHKHGTGKARVEVRYTASTVVLHVTNALPDGGPDVHRPGYGLIGMRERAAAVGADLRVGPVSSRQFQVALTLPC